MPADVEFDFVVEADIKAEWRPAAISDEMLVTVLVVAAEVMAKKAVLACNYVDGRFPLVVAVGVPRKAR